MQLLASLAATLVSLVFAGLVLAQFWARRHLYQAVWGASLLLFGIGTGMQFLAELSGWSIPLYRLWYLAGAILTVAYLGLGTIYLLVPRRAAHGIAAVLLLASAYATVAVMAAPVDLALALAGGPISGAGMPPSVRLLTPIFNIFGTVAMAGGALYSAWAFRRRGAPGQRVTGNLLIAVGALVVAFGGTATRLGRPELLYLTELLGLTIVFAGFLVVQARPARARVPLPGGAASR